MVHVILALIMITAPDGRILVAHKPFPTVGLCETYVSKTVFELREKYPEIDINAGCLEFEVEAPRKA